MGSKKNEKEDTNGVKGQSVTSVSAKTDYTLADGGPVISAKSLRGVTNILGSRGGKSKFPPVSSNDQHEKRSDVMQSPLSMELSHVMLKDRDTDKKHQDYLDDFEYDTQQRSQSKLTDVSLVTTPLLKDGTESSLQATEAGTFGGIGPKPTEENIFTDTEVGYGGFNKAPLYDPALSKVPRSKKTWDGVFLPVSISVFGVVLFIRLPWIIGQCGLYLTLGGIAISYTTSGLTTISLAAISTNGFVGDGGPYMMISRCLGPQVGTVIGIIFVISNLISCAMFLSGGSQSFVTMFNWEQMIIWDLEHKYLTTVVISTIMLIILLIIALLSIEKPFRVICLVLTFISLLDAMVCIPSAWYGGTNTKIGFTGWSSKSWYDNLYPDFDNNEGFPTVLAVLFTGVTGVMSGVCLSGDLRSGAKAIPRGIGYAWVLSLVTYLILAVLISGSFERWALKEKLTIMSHVTHPYLYLPGEAVSSFAAVLAMMAGSSRVLQAMAKDDLLNSRVLRFIGQSSKKSAIVCFALVVQCFILAGNIFMAASVLATQAFCVNFMALNMSTFISAVSGVVSFRPIYRFFNHFTALIGAAFCLGVMFYVSPIEAVVFNVVLISMFAFVDLYIDTSCLPYGDASQPLVFFIVRKWLLRLDERKEHIRHWRPSIIQVNTDPWCSLNLTHLCNNLKKGGIFEQAFIVRGTYSQTVKGCRRWKGWAMDYISASRIKAFALVGFGEDLRSGVQYLLRTCGLGGMRPNTVVVSLDELLLKDSYLKMYRTFSRVKYNQMGVNFGGIVESGPLNSTPSSSQNCVPISSTGDTTLKGIPIPRYENCYYSDDEHGPTTLSPSFCRSKLLTWESPNQVELSGNYNDQFTTNKRPSNVVRFNNLGDVDGGSYLPSSIRRRSNFLTQKKNKRLSSVAMCGSYELANTARTETRTSDLEGNSNANSFIRKGSMTERDEYCDPCATDDVRENVSSSQCRGSTLAPFGNLPDWLDHAQTSSPVINEDIRNALRGSGIRMPEGALEGMFVTPISSHYKALRGERPLEMDKDASGNPIVLEGSPMNSTRNNIRDHLLSTDPKQINERTNEYRTRSLKPSLFRRFLKFTGLGNASLQSKINLRDNLMSLYKDSGGTDSNRAGYLQDFYENFEADQIENYLIELMINQRSQALNNNEPDLATYSGYEEFASIVSDVALVSMSLVISRNIYKLDKDSIEAKAKDKKGGGRSTIDLWLPEDNDAVMFLMAYSLSRTSIWRKYCDIRVVSVVVNDVDIEDQNIHMKAFLKEHRIIATVHTVSLTGEMRRMGITDLDTMEELLETPSTRFETLNNIIRHNIKDTAIIFCRVEPFSLKPTPCMGDDAFDETEEERETRMKEWFASIIALSTDLPPILMVSGGSVRGQSTDW